MYSVYDLSFAYMMKFYKEEPSRDEKKKIIGRIRRVLKNGWTSEDIIKGLKPLPAGAQPNLYEMFDGIKTGKDRNLIIPDEEFLYHNLYRCSPKPPTVNWDIDSGDIVSQEYEYYLEMRASITSGQILDYYCKQFDVSSENQENRFKGIILKMKERHSLDMIAFMIDTKSNLVKTEHSRKPMSPFDIENVEYEAKLTLEEKINSSKTMGVDKVVPRKREFIQPSRDGSKAS